MVGEKTGTPIEKVVLSPDAPFPCHSHHDFAENQKVLCDQQRLQEQWDCAKAKKKGNGNCFKHFSLLFLVHRPAIVDQARLPLVCGRRTGVTGQWKIELPQADPIEGF